jgi:uncharacterized protein (TIGR02996 family)
MFVLVVTGPDGTRLRRPFVKPEITLGCRPDNDVVLLASGVARQHARVVTREDKFIVVDLATATGTRVSGEMLRAPVVVKPGERIEIDPYTIVIEAIEVPPVAARFEAADATEAALVDAVARGDAGAVTVYADWLEERGEVARAEFLRVQNDLVAATGHIAAHEQRLLELCLEIDVRWRACVARRAVERCVDQLTCPKEWNALRPTAQDGVRHCETCRKDVFYCVSVVEAKARAREGACVALDLTTLRRPHDLEPTQADLCSACGADVGSVRPCPRCGDERQRSQKVGRMMLAPR